MLAIVVTIILIAGLGAGTRPLAKVLDWEKDPKRLAILAVGLLVVGFVAAAVMKIGVLYVTALVVAGLVHYFHAHVARYVKTVTAVLPTKTKTVEETETVSATSKVDTI